MKSSDLLASLKAVVAFLVLLLGLSFVVLFSQNRDDIVNSNSFGMFMFLLVIGLSLLLGLVFLVNNSHGGITKTKTSKSKKRRR